VHIQPAIAITSSSSSSSVTCSRAVTALQILCRAVRTAGAGDASAADAAADGAAAAGAVPHTLLNCTGVTELSPCHRGRQALHHQHWGSRERHAGRTKCTIMMCEEQPHVLDVGVCKTSLDIPLCEHQRHKQHRCGAAVSVKQPARLVALEPTWGRRNSRAARMWHSCWETGIGVITQLVKAVANIKSPQALSVSFVSSQHLSGSCSEPRWPAAPLQTHRGFGAQRRGSRTTAPPCLMLATTASAAVRGAAMSCRCWRCCCHCRSGCGGWWPRSLQSSMRRLRCPVRDCWCGSSCSRGCVLGRLPAEVLL